jgi:predicted oxidoreductase
MSHIFWIQDGLCALAMACELGDAATAQVLLDQSPDLSVTDKVQYSSN